MLNHVYEPMFLSLSYAPPKLCKLPPKIFSPFLTRMNIYLVNADPDVQCNKDQS